MGVQNGGYKVCEKEKIGRIQGLEWELLLGQKHSPFLINRMEKTRDLVKKIRDTKGTFHGKMGSINDRNGMDLTEVEDTKKRWQEYTEELYEKRSL